jgi:hypothetical protein
LFTLCFMELELIQDAITMLLEDHFHLKFRYHGGPEHGPQSSVLVLHIPGNDY